MRVCSVRMLMSNASNIRYNSFLQLHNIYVECSKKEIEILEAELNKIDGKTVEDPKPKADEKEIENFDLQEPTMISIPQLPLPYQPGGGGPSSAGGVGNINYLSSADEILNTEFSPPDRYFTVSAVLGRLKEPLNLPVMANVDAMEVEETEQVKAKKQMMLAKQQVRDVIDHACSWNARRMIVS